MDQEPKNLFEIDDKSGVIRSKQPLDREKHRSFTVGEVLWARVKSLRRLRSFLEGNQQK